jgi:adenylosuccinate synthase
MLDVDYGTNPDTTSSHLTAPAGLASLGLSRRLFEIYLVEKIYPTRVGSGYMPTLDESDFGTQVALNAGEFGATTGRKRRVGYPDLVVVAYSAMVNDADGIYLTRVDCVQDWPLRVCHAYNFGGEEVTEVPLRLDQARPIYSDKTYNWHLWDGSRNFADPLKRDAQAEEARDYFVRQGFMSLPGPIDEFVRDHDSYVGVPIVGISIGPKRGQTIPVPSRI